VKEFAFDEEMSIGMDVTVHVSGHGLDWDYEDHREVRSISIGGTDLPEDLVKRLAPYLQKDVDSFPLAGERTV